MLGLHHGLALLMPAGQVLGMFRNQTCLVQRINNRKAKLPVVDQPRMVKSITSKVILIKHNLAAGPQNSSINGSNSNQSSVSRHSLKTYKDRRVKRIEDLNPRGIMVFRPSRDSTCLSTSYKLRSRDSSGAARKIPSSNLMSTYVCYRTVPCRQYFLTCY